MWKTASPDEKARAVAVDAGERADVSTAENEREVETTPRKAGGERGEARTEWIAAAHGAAPIPMFGMCTSSRTSISVSPNM